jgi:hypothetical protein
MKEMKNYWSQYQTKDSFKWNVTEDEMKNYWSQYLTEDSFKWNNTKEEMHNFCLKNNLYYLKKIEYKK